MRSFLQLIFFIFLSGISLHAANPEKLELNPEIWKETKKDYKFDPSKENTESVEKFETIPDDSSWDVEALSPFLYVLVFIVVLIVLILIIKNFKQPVNVKSKRLEATSIEEAEDNLPDVTLNKIHQEAIQRGDFKSALRIKFLMLLQSMIDAGLIIWKKRKTNEQYLAELNQYDQKNTFNHIVILYDRVWYGSASITEVQYQMVTERIKSLDNHLHGEE